ncbi:MAG: tRNA (adenosine(37)-N6)-threonylcarbamoyltransferase complex dimerization subunit type 1 TsaB, partial [Candidatus Omnitrophota bacterium]|nr:tRNA (adenosine(37)-N6)-threonylcarbamoyltransferase complex dimerization subunit type 1 TsaB [Candidatus Omnitrophota bacterium]
KNGKIVSRLHKKAAMAHSSILVPSIDRVLKKAKLKIKDVDVFAISVGPGSFTGLRIGVTTVKGLAYSLKKKIVAVPTLDVIANNVKDLRGIICPILDARKNKVYSCIYRSDGKFIKRISPHLLLPLEELKKKLAAYDKIHFLGDVIGDAIFKPGLKSKLQSRLVSKTDKSWYPRAEIVAELALEEIGNKRFLSPEDLEPLYIYSKECDITGK